MLLKLCGMCKWLCGSVSICVSKIVWSDYMYQSLCGSVSVVNRCVGLSMRVSWLGLCMGVQVVVWV